MWGEEPELWRIGLLFLGEQKPYLYCAWCCPCVQVTGVTRLPPIVVRVIVAVWKLCTVSPQAVSSTFIVETTFLRVSDMHSTLKPLLWLIWEDGAAPMGEILSLSLKLSAAAFYSCRANSAARVIAHGTKNAHWTGCSKPPCWWTLVRSCFGPPAPAMRHMVGISIRYARGLQLATKAIWHVGQT